LDELERLRRLNPEAEVYRPRFLGHRIEAYAAMAAV
jgi:hypothetical protein